jgi:hypothetical protein
MNRGGRSQAGNFSCHPRACRHHLNLVLLGSESSFDFCFLLLLLVSCLASKLTDFSRVLF